jgi:hypothetical protein
MSTNERGHSASSSSFAPFIMLLVVLQGKQYEVLASFPAYLKNIVVESSYKYLKDGYIR